MADTDLVVEVEPVVTEPVVETKTAEPEKKAEPKTDPVADLKQQLVELEAAKTAETSARQRAESEAATARAEATKQAGEVAKAKVSLTESNISAVDNAIAAAEAEAEGFARDQVAALAAGKFDDAAAFGRKAARAEARIERLQEGKSDLEARKNEAPKTETRSPQADAFETVIAQSTPRAQQWLRAHPTYVTDPSLNRKANIAHLKALDKGLEVDSDAYFEFAEQELGLKQAPEVKTEPKQKQTKAMPSAPVSRDSSPTGGALSSTQVTLTPGEVARATDGTIVHNYNDPNGKFKKGEAIGVKEYARRKLALQQQGAYDRSYVEN